MRLKRTALVTILVAATGLMSAVFAWAKSEVPSGATYIPKPGSTEYAPAGTGSVRVDWHANCKLPPSTNPAAQNYWHVASIAHHQNGSQAVAQSTALQNVDSASGHHDLVLTMEPRGRKSETFRVEVHVVCDNQDELLSNSTLTLVRGTKRHRLAQYWTGLRGSTSR